MPCPACSELPTLRELKTPRNQTGNFLRDLSCSDLKCRTAQQICSITPRDLAKKIIFNEEGTPLQ